MGISASGFSVCRMSLKKISPKLEPRTNEPGILLHGENPFTDLLKRTLSQCFKVQRTGKTPDGLQEGYQRGAVMQDTTVIWLELGDGPPWAEPFNCRD